MNRIFTAALAAAAAIVLPISATAPALADDAHMMGQGGPATAGETLPLGPGMMVQTTPMGPQWMMTPIMPMGQPGIGPVAPGSWPMWGPQAMRPGGMGGAFHLFRIVDIDGDSVVSHAEAAANREEMFVNMDADEDGALTGEEYMAVGFGPGAMMAGGAGPFHAQAQERKAAAFAAMDGDGDGDVDQREWMVAGEERFGAADLDGDGAVSVWEFRSVRRF